MKYGAILPPAAVDDSSNVPVHVKAKDFVLRWRNFLLIVVLPTLIFAAYQYLVTADQYESEAEFLVKSGQSSEAPSGSLGQMFGIGGHSQSQSEILSVPDYLRSHEIVAELQKRMDLVAIFRRPEADYFSRLNENDPAPETLLKDYRRRVKVTHNSDTGIIHISAKTYRPEDSYRIGTALLLLGERKINEMNRRSYDDALKSARFQLQRAEENAASIQSRVTQFRQSNSDIDPEMSGQAQIKLVADLNARLAAANAQLSNMGGVISRNSPQYLALTRQVRSLEAEMQAQTSKMGGRSTDITRSIGQYEDLKVRQEFAAKNYEAAAANLQSAYEKAQKQQLYFVHVVDPNKPVKSLFPKREKNVLTFFFVALVVYGIGWLLVAGVREHEA